MKKNNLFESAVDYFESQPDDIKVVLFELKKCILSVAPNAKELINYNIPAYQLIDGGKRDAQIMIGANKNSVGLYPHPSTIQKFELELSAYKRGKGSVQFSINKPLPKELIIKMVAYRYEILKNSKS